MLGDIGCNFAAGMTGGKAYVFDPANLTETRVNLESVELDIPSHAQLHQLEMLVRVHALLTESQWAQQLMATWLECSRLFRFIAPRHTAKPAWIAPSVLTIPEIAPPAFPQA